MKQATASVTISQVLLFWVFGLTFVSKSASVWQVFTINQ